MRTLTIASDDDQPFDLDQVRIATPCDMDWKEMRGDERKRFCDACSLHVYNISEMTRGEVRALFVEAEGRRVCGRLFRRKDGTVISQDCPVGLAEKAWRAARNGSLTVAASMLTVVAFLMGALFFFVRSEVTVDPAMSTQNANWQVEVKKPPPVEEILEHREKVLELRELPKPGGMLAPPRVIELEVMGDMILEE